ncbi:MAG: type II secretion system F family protein [Acidimicrobiia bacterium]
MTWVAVLLGAAFASGVLMAATGLRPSDRAEHATTHVASFDWRRVGLTLGAGLVGLLWTRWPVAGMALAGLAWSSPHLLGGKAGREHAMAKTEAIASWTEMLRDTISAAHGIEAAISATASLSPPPIRAEVRDLARRIERDPLDAALADLADDLAHPIADLVVAALTAAANNSTRELGELLSTLAASARDEATMQLRVEAARARMRTAVRVIAGVTLVTALGLILGNPTYVEPYTSALGQIVLATICGCWGAALWWLNQMSRFTSPERFLLPRTVEGAAR